MDDSVAESYGMLAARIVRAGRRHRSRSLDLIAATAHAHGALLYTRNVDDFRGLDGVLTVETV